MAEIAPFRGLLYNQELVPQLDAVVTPPYDVISPEEQESFYESHPYNMIRLILGKPEPGDNEHQNWYRRAAATLRDWQQQGILVRDSEPAFYDYEIEYRQPPNILKVRHGFICMVRLEEFSSGTVRPHERTYEKTRSERLQLLNECKANLSQIFSLYADPAGIVSHYLKEGRHGRPVFDFVDRSGIHHRLWRVTRKDIVNRVMAVMRDKPLFLADGHHRYETALEFQRQMRQRYPNLGKQAACNYVLMYLSNMNHTGLTILPTHRMFVELPQYDTRSFLEKAGRYFEVSRYPFSGHEQERVLEEFLAALEAAREQTFLGVYAREMNEFLLLQLRSEAKHQSWQKNVPSPLQKLDVVVLTELVLKELLRVDDHMLNDEERIHYRHDAREAIAQVDRGLYQVAFLINPTRIEQVQEVASAGLIMPHKSTYFYPKVINGSVLALVDPHENIPL
ncbi:MAG: DUF1015 domain-containing protein [Deltaproteobacteria bacterium]|nr:DUF1015 domain-containing protein [Deltaproteobacteria bacterium]